MWLIHQNAILTKDNLIKRKWQGDSRCLFCPEQETISHLFFECPLAKFVWSIVAMVVGAPCRPCSFDQFWTWVQIYMSGGELFHMVGLAAICWSIWRSRNNVCFEKKKIRSPTEIICLASSFIVFWTELQKAENPNSLVAGAEALKNMALRLHPHGSVHRGAGGLLIQ